MFNTLNQIKSKKPTWDISFISRGGLPFAVEHGDVHLDVLPWGTQEEIESDLERADLLYLPLPIDPEFESFTRYSLSTKLVTYLGSGIPILYHGPADSAAALLLGKYDAAICSSSTDPDELTQTVLTVQERSDVVVANALDLARDQFMLRDQLETFWGLLNRSPSQRIGCEGRELTATDTFVNTRQL